MDRREELSMLIIKLIGERSQRRTAQDTGVTASYITGIINKKYLPSAETLRKLSAPESKPRNGVTLHQLMVAAGYQEESTPATIEQLMNMIKERDLIIEQQRKQIDEIRRVLCI